MNLSVARRQTVVLIDLWGFKNKLLNAGRGVLEYLSLTMYHSEHPNLSNQVCCCLCCGNLGLLPQYLNVAFGRTSRIVSPEIMTHFIKKNPHSLFDSSSLEGVLSFTVWNMHKTHGGSHVKQQEVHLYNYLYDAVTSVFLQRLFFFSLKKSPPACYKFLYLWFSGPVT